MHVWQNLKTIKISQRIFTMLDTPVPIRTLKLSNIGPGYYLDERPFREFQVLLAPIPLFPLPPCGQSTVFSDSLCLNQVIETRWNKKNNQNFHNKISHRFLLTTKQFTGQKSY